MYRVKNMLKIQIGFYTNFLSQYCTFILIFKLIFYLIHSCNFISAIVCPVMFSNSKLNASRIMNPLYDHLNCSLNAFHLLFENINGQTDTETHGSFLKAHKFWDLQHSRHQARSHFVALHCILSRFFENKLLAKFFYLLVYWWFFSLFIYWYFIKYQYSVYFFIGFAKNLNFWSIYFLGFQNI